MITCKKFYAVYKPYLIFSIGNRFYTRRLYSTGRDYYVIISGEKKPVFPAVTDPAKNYIFYMVEAAHENI